MSTPQIIDRLLSELVVNTKLRPRVLLRVFFRIPISKTRVAERHHGLGDVPAVGQVAVRVDCRSRFLAGTDGARPCQNYLTVDRIEVVGFRLSGLSRVPLPRTPRLSRND